MDIIYKRLGEIKPYKNNAKKHDITQAEAEKARAEIYELSDREKEIIKNLSKFS